MAKTAVLNKADNTLIKIVNTAEEKKEFDGRDDVRFMTSKNFEATDQFKSWDEMTGKVKPVEGEEAAEPKKTAVPLEGPYYIVKPLPPTPADHPKMPIWNAIITNDGKTCQEAKAACPTENPARKTSGKYTFSSEFRYFLKTGYVALGDKPEGYDYTAQAKPAKEEKPEGEKKPAKAKKAKKEAEPAASADAEPAQATGEAQNETADGGEHAA